MRGRGTLDPSRNPNAYPMTDEVRFPSAVRVRVNGVVAGRYDLPDDPADHRGILSWHAQPRDRKLREAGSYGYLLEVPIPRAALEQAAAERGARDPPGGGRGAARRSRHLRRALRPLSAGPHGGLRAQPATRGELGEVTMRDLDARILPGRLCLPRRLHPAPAPAARTQRKRREPALRGDPRRRRRGPLHPHQRQRRGGAGDDLRWDHPLPAGARPGRQPRRRRAGLRRPRRLPRGLALLRRHHRALRQPHRRREVHPRRRGVRARRQQRPERPPRRAEGLRQGRLAWPSPFENEEGVGVVFSYTSPDGEEGLSRHARGQGHLHPHRRRTS